MTQDVVDQIVSRIEEVLGPTPLSRTGNPPQILMCYRAAEPFEKISTQHYTMPDGSKAHFEILGAGQQVVAFGVHPVTWQPYRWLDRSPADTPLAELPEITAEQARVLINEVAAIIEASGGVPDKPEKPVTPPPDRRNSNGDTFFHNHVNNAALDNIAAGAPALQQGEAGADMSDPVLQLTVFPDLFAKTGIEANLSPAQFVELEQTGNTPSHLGTGSIYRPECKTKLSLLSLHRYGDARSGNGALRCNANVLTSFGCVGDYDGEQLGFEEAVEKLNRAQIAAIVYSSPSYSPEKPRWRVCCWYSEPQLPSIYSAMISRVNGALGGVLAPESWTLSQGYFYGQVKDGHPVLVLESEGQPIDQRDELDLTAIGRPARVGPVPPEAEDAPHTPGEPQTDIANIGAALACIPNDWVDWNEYKRLALAVFASCGGSDEGKALFIEWSAQSPAYAAAESEAVWEQVRRSPPDRIGFGSLVYWARQGDPKFTPTPTPTPRAKPIIQIVGGDIAGVVDAAEDHLIALDHDLYQRGDFIVRPGTVPMPISDNRTAPGLRLIPVKKNHLVERLTYWIDFYKWDRRGKGRWVLIDCPSKVAATYLERVGCWRLHVLTGVTNCPTLRPDGSILDQPGYDAATGILYNPRGVEFPEIPQNPSKDDAVRALAVLKAPIKEFKFVDAASKSVALSGFLTATTRRSLITAPLHAVDGPVAGAGKSKLVNIASIIASGHEAPVCTPGETKEEFEKRLGSQLLAGDAVISFDNCDDPLSSALLCQVLTESFPRIRILGKSEMPVVPNNAAFFATGTNLVLVGHLTRRAIRATIDPQCERPELLEFDDKDLIGTVFRNRPRLVAAALTILRAHHVAGRPVSGAPLGSFETWWGWPRAALVWLDEADPCDTMEKMRQDDPQTQALANVLAQWKAAFGADELTTNEIVDRATEYAPQPPMTDFNSHRPDFMLPELREVLLAVAAERGRVDTNRLGFWLRSVKGRIIKNMRIVHGLRKRSWKLEETQQ